MDETVAASVRLALDSENSVAEIVVVAVGAEEVGTAAVD